ncbi:HTH-type transcriptional activator RhaR [Sporomusa carbonis]|uniref:helix-turn-helix domain-containing protein n=1 Tax=Sporomusa carbonis TaxID=3076075 RepID=UPI003A781120
MSDGELWSLNKNIISNKHWQLIREAIRREFAFETIFGNTVGEIEKYLTVFNIQLLPTMVMLLQADTDEGACFDKAMLETRQKEIYSRIVQMIEQDVDGIITVFGQENIFAITAGERDVALLLPVELHDQVDFKVPAKRYGRHIKAYISKDLNYSISVGIGRGYDFKQIRKSYAEACAALKFKFYQGNGAIVHYNDISWCDHESQRMFIQYETTLLESIRKGEWQQTTAVINDMLDTIGRSRLVHPDVLKVRVLEMLTVVSRVAMELGAEPEILLEIKIRSGDEIAGITTLSEIRTWLAAIVNEMCALLQSKQQAAVVRAVTHAKQYIMENYYRDISLEDLARREYLSSSYFSRAFTELVGMSFTDYLKNVRIKKAQALLLTTDKGVAEIAAKVGYQDPNYFSRVFRVATGKSPLQYRRGKTSKIFCITEA